MYKNPEFENKRASKNFLNLFPSVYIANNMDPDQAESSLIRNHGVYVHDKIRS